MSDETTEFPFPYDVTDDERAAVRSELGKYARIVSEDSKAIRFEGKALGQTGPIWRFQYLRMYQLHTGFLVAGHELREGINVFHADSAEALPRCFAHEGVAEFIEDELRFRGVIGSEHARA